MRPRRLFAGPPVAAFTGFTHFVKNTLIRASQTENAPGDRVELLNRIFNAAYRVRLVGKAIKKKSRVAHYTLKWLLLGGVLYLIFR